MKFYKIPQQNWDKLKAFIDYDGLQPDRRACEPSEIKEYWEIVNGKYEVFEEKT